MYFAVYCNPFCIVVGSMASSERENSIYGSDEDRTSPLSTKPTLPESEFGLGLCDNTYQQRTWSGMGELFQSEKLSDVMLMAEGQSIACHKFLLAAASEYFYNFVVETERDNPNLLEIPGISFNALKVIVNYLYTGNVNITAENAKDVIPVFKMLKLKSAYDICEKFALGMVNPGNCIDVYKMATENDVQQLSAKALDMMVNNFTEVVSGSEFLAMSEKDVMNYMQNENLKIPNEDPVFEAVVSWVRHQPQERESSFPRLITHVRLRYCSPHYLRQVVSKDPLMDNRECQKLLVASFIHQSYADVPGHHRHDSSNDHDPAPRKAYARRTTLVIAGGSSDPGHIIQTDCCRLEEAGWRVMEQCPIPTSVEMFSACIIKEGILLTGGYDNGKPVSQCWLLSTLTYQWSFLPDLNTARARHATVCVGGQPYVIAGVDSDGNEMSSMERLFCEKWDMVPKLPKALVHPMVACHGQNIYMFGGVDMEWNPSQSVFVYDTNMKSWQTLTDMPQKCTFGSAVMWKDRIYIVGGFDQSCMCYDPILAQWSTLSQCRHQHADGPALVWKDRILVSGGRSNKANCNDDNQGGTSVIEEYDPEKDTWTMSQIELPQKLWAHFVFNIGTDN